MKEKVLILDGGATHAMAIAECLKKTGYWVAVMCNNKYEYGYHTKYADEHFIGLDSHSPKYPEFIFSFLENNKFDVLIPTSDKSAEFISFNKSKLQRLTGVLMPERKIFELGYDKNKLMHICQENGYPCPMTIDLHNWDISSNEIIKNFPFPALLKPNLTSGGRGMTLIRNFDELKTIYPRIRKLYGDCHLQKYIERGGKQIKVQIITDKDGNLAYSSVIWKQRYYPVNGGSSCCNITIHNPEIVAICSNVLKKIGWVGFADFDLIEDKDSNELLIMEINPRIPACIRSAFKSGIDYATMIADMTLDKPFKNYNYIPGKKLRHIGFEILWFIKSPNRLKSTPSWFNFFDKDLYFQDWLKGDFMAFLMGSLGNIKKQMNPEFRKSKAGVK